MDASPFFFLQANSPALLVLIGLSTFALSFLGAAVGLVLGHLRLPLLILYVGNPAAGTASNLLISGLGAMAGTIRHLQEGRVSLKVLLVMGGPSILGAILAAFVFAVYVSSTWAILTIGLMLVVSGINLAWTSKVEPPSGAGQQPNMVLEVLIGLFLGALAAVTGLMLGSLRLPMMIRLLRIDPRVAVGTNMAIGCVTGLIGAITTLCVANIDWGQLLSLLAVLAPPTVLGGYFGGWLTGKLSKETIQSLAAWIIIVSGVLMVGQQVHRLVKPLQTDHPVLPSEEYPGQDDMPEDEDPLNFLEFDFF